MNPHSSDFRCDATRKHLADLLDQEVSPREAARLLGHFESCPDCATHYQSEYQTLAYLRASIQALALPEGLMERIQDAILRDVPTPAQKG